MILPHVRCEITSDALLPIWHLERAGVAPRLQNQLFLDRACKARRPLEPREGIDGGLDEARAEKVRAQADVVCRGVR